jgi:hypothetical protein
MFGARGILRGADMYRKQAEFDAWLREVKRLPNYHGPKGETAELFAEYAEDFNTCTLPHEKFYDMEKWEAEERAGRSGRAGGGGGGGGGGDGSLSLAQQDEVRRAEAAVAAARKEAERMALLRSSLAPERVAAMKRQAELQQAMQYAFRAGDMKEVARLQKLLEPDDPRELK